MLTAEGHQITAKHSSIKPLPDKQLAFIKKLTMLVSGGMFIDGFILGAIGIVMPAITEDLRLSHTSQGLIGAAALIGIFIGGPLGGYLADRIGRTRMFTFDLAIFLIGSFAQFFVTEVWQLIAIRLLMGVAIGADYAIGWPLLAEFAPVRMRGKLLAVQDLGWYVGFLIAYGLGWGLTISHSADWKVILGLSTIPTAIVFLLRLGTPESPRWLMSKGRVAEATAIAEEYMCEEEQRDLDEPSPTAGKGFLHLFSTDYVKATVFVCVFYFCNVAPYFAIGTFAPFVLEQLGVRDGLAGGLALNIFSVLGTLTTVILIERIGRRKLAIPPFYISTVALLLVAMFSNTSPMLIVCCFLTFFFVNAVSATLVAVYSAEVFPTEVRGAGTGFATAVSRVGAAAGTFLLPTGMETLGVATILVIAAVICLVGGIVSQILAPETMGKPLSETCAPTRWRA